jgi:hypothetical protein
MATLKKFAQAVGGHLEIKPVPDARSTGLQSHLSPSAWQYLFTSGFIAAPR